MTEVCACARWRDNLGEECCALIESAVERLAADERYEGPDGPKLRDTLGHLSDLQRQAKDLIATINRLSPVGMAAMNDAGDQRAVYTGRHKLWELRDELIEIVVSAEAGAQMLVQMHSSFTDSGQGTGSAIGRDSDLRAIRVDHDQSTRLPPFRSPKDKFAIRVIMALIDAGFDPATRGATRVLQQRLNEIWAGFRGGEPPNWVRVIKARHAIAEWVVRKQKSRAVWKKAVTKGNATSVENAKMPT